MLFLPRGLFLYFPSDVNECQSLKNNCHSKAECVNTLGSFDCRCKLGYLGDGVNCTCKLPLSVHHHHRRRQFHTD